MTTVAMFLSLLTVLSAQAQSVAIPSLTTWVTDTTNTFTAQQKQNLSAQLQALEQSKGAQIFVLMVPTTGEDTIDSYARRVYDKWKPGRKGVDDGILFVVAKEDRRLRIEVGYGLEGAVTDLQSGRIIREYVTPKFVEGDYVGGIQAGVDVLVGLVNGEELPPPSTSNMGQLDDDEGPLAMLLPLAFMAWLMPSWFAALAIGIFVFLMFWSLPIALIAAVVAFVISKVGRVFGAGGRSSSARASRRGAAIGGLGGFTSSGGFGGGGGMGGGGMGGGGASGGGGSSGGGGASGGW